MKVKLILLFIAAGLFVSCQNEKPDQEYLITKSRVGKLTEGIRVNQLDSVFAGDSVVMENNSRRFSGRNEITIYKKGGKELLRLHPAESFDSLSNITSVEILDTLYKTEKGLGKNTTFELLRTNYNISRIENTLGTALVFIDDLNMYVDIDKKDIAEPTEMGVKIKASQIKNSAKIKHIWVDWE